MENDDSTMSVTVTKLPLWRSCLDAMKKEGMSFKSSWPVEYFEDKLKCKREEHEFIWEMLSLRAEIESEHGYYLRSSENGKLFSIPDAPDHEDVAQSFETKLRRYAVRAMALRAEVLMNPKATLTEEQRHTMESNMEKASVRLVLLARSTSIVNAVKKHAPELLRGIITAKPTSENPL